LLPNLVLAALLALVVTYAAVNLVVGALAVYNLTQLEM
jgi:hypothetical protein